VGPTALHLTLTLSVTGSAGQGHCLATSSLCQGPPLLPSSVPFLLWFLLFLLQWQLHLSRSLLPCFSFTAIPLSFAPSPPLPPALAQPFPAPAQQTHIFTGSHHSLDRDQLRPCSKAAHGLERASAREDGVPPRRCPHRPEASEAHSPLTDLLDSHMALALLPSPWPGRRTSPKPSSPGPDSWPLSPKPPAC
jgi:hypothetical protein